MPALDEMEDPRDLERKIEQASRIASRVHDPTTYQRLTSWVDELKQKLKSWHYDGAAFPVARQQKRPQRSIPTAPRALGPFLCTPRATLRPVSGPSST